MIAVLLGGPQDGLEVSGLAGMAPFLRVHCPNGREATLIVDPDALVRDDLVATYDLESPDAGRAFYRWRHPCPTG